MRASLYGTIEMDSQLQVGDEVEIESLTVRVTKIEEEMVDVTGLGDRGPQFVPGERTASVWVIRP